MKKFAINILSIGVLAASFTSCDDAKNDVIENRVYIAEAASTPINDLLMGDEGICYGSADHSPSGKKNAD